MLESGNLANKISKKVAFVEIHVGALETEEYFDNLKVYFISHENDLSLELKILSRNMRRQLLGFLFPQLNYGIYTR